MTYYGINQQYMSSGYRWANYVSMLVVIISQVLYVFKSAKYKWNWLIIMLI